MAYRFPSLNALKAFEASARHLSFKAAAGERGVTAGAVSQQVKRLEASQGIALFQRLPQSLRLTRERTACLTSISEAVDRLTEPTEAVAPTLNGRKLSVGVPEPVVADAWCWQSTTLDTYVSGTFVSDHVASIRRDELDAPLLDRAGDHEALARRPVSIEAIVGP